MDGAGFGLTSVHVYQTTWCHIQAAHTYCTLEGSSV